MNSRPSLHYLNWAFLLSGLLFPGWCAQDALHLFTESDVELAVETNAPVNSGGMVALDAEDRFTWDEFTSLTHPSVQGQPKTSAEPEWFIWKDKCAAGLANSCKSTSTPRDSSIGIDAASAEFPRQILLDFAQARSKHEDTAFARTYAEMPQLASVLFNPEAAASIRRSNLGQRSTLDLAVEQLDAGKRTGHDRRLPEGTFEIGSEIVKLVWEIVPIRQQLRLYDPDKVPVEKGDSLYRVPAWLSRYVIDPDPKKSCHAPLPPYGTPSKPETVSINCFYWFKVQGTSSCDSLSPEVLQVWCHSPLRNEAFYAVLVAFHVMKLVATNPNWIWMTYYWTRKPNDGETGSGTAWEAPWNHFHQYSTTAIREAGPLAHQICSNPYLEGSGPSGLKANCLSCHSFAAYSPTSNKQPAGVKLGFRFPYPLSERADDEKDYFTGSVQTALVWSISDNQDSDTQALLNSFESAIAKLIEDQAEVK